MSENKELTLSSSFEEIQSVESFAKELQQWAQFSDDNLGRIMLTLSEAVTNAIVHGNKEDPQKKVFVSAEYDARMLKIEVEDEGEGFNPDKLPNPLKKENLLDQGGRGVYLIKQYSDKVEYSNGGRKVTMHFQLDPKH